ncbi:type I secretion system permease/ATPase [Salinarimonas rosea]|uniref:type I secretion system permease/ATPase n=1 Tax=Salinarimonas rosea TaxID=552063 RepID=UPI00041A076D|nr:type I secretion system permease/ATPase [Salinarimonas rosea]
MRRDATQPSPAAAARGGVLAVALFSAVINILMLTGALYMLEVYDRVLPSRSVETLVALSVIALALFGLLGVLDVVRGRLLARIGARIDAGMAERAFGFSVRLPLAAPGADARAPLRDLDLVRSFLAGPGPTAFLDLPWLPVYLVVAFAIHPTIGWTTAAGAGLLIGLALLAERASRGPGAAALEAGAHRDRIAEAGRRNAESLAGMGLAARIGDIWNEAHTAAVAAQQRGSDIVGGLGAVSRALRLVLQSAVLGVGAYLVVAGELSAGLIIAASVLASRALAPVEQAIAHWRGFNQARGAWRRLGDLDAALPAPPQPLALPAPRTELRVEDLAVATPGDRRTVLVGASFVLRAGDALGIVGPSGSGKSSLARALVGVWPAQQGAVRLDGAPLERYAPETLGRHVGWLPQDPSLVEGTVAQTISRFDPQAPAEAIVAAARAADVHELVLRLPQGYETRVGEGGMALSGGQRQRLALARALYGEPFLVVLDEPNASLDAEGEAALARAIAGVRARGGIVVIIAHALSALAGVDTLAAMVGGRIAAYGPKADVLARIAPPRRAPRPSLEVVADGTR